MNFGKLNVNDSMNSEIASTFGVDITGVNLPAIIIFSKGQEFSRVPTLLPNGKSVKWKMNEVHFSIPNSLYWNSNSKKKKKKKKKNLHRKLQLRN